MGGNLELGWYTAATGIRLLFGTKDSSDHGLALGRKSVGVRVRVHVLHVTLAKFFSIAESQAM